jgi:prepilin-type N-terminal cleavage/methylation domain-containing protein
MRHAFTLIELLVVITIIVVLLALLTPSLDRAIYQAELLQCSGNQKVIGTAAIQYCFENKRYYPNRTNMPTGDSNAYLQPNNLTSPVEIGYDLRPMLRDKLGLKINQNMQCAMVEPVDLEDTLPDEFVFGNQLMFFGWYYFIGGQRLAGMHKYGDRFTAPTPGDGRKRFNLLVGDFDLNRYGQGYQCSHPDQSTGHMYNLAAKRVGLFTAVTFPHTISYWWTGMNPTQSPARGPLDLNFMYDDGSVRRFDNMLTDTEEERGELILNNYAQRETYYFQVPAQ